MILAFLQIFSKLGIPNTIHCDGGSNFLSKTFQEFCANLNISLQFSSSYHHSSNSAKRAVSSVKNIMKKCMDEQLGNSAWRIGLIQYLCMPISDSLQSSAEILNQRVYKGYQPFLHDNGTLNLVLRLPLISSLKERGKRNFIMTDLRLFQINQLFLKDKIFGTGTTLRTSGRRVPL